MEINIYINYTKHIKSNIVNIYINEFKYRFKNSTLYI